MAESFISKVAGAALAQFEPVMDWLGLAGGKRHGREYLPTNPTRTDHKPGSFSINMDSGCWMDGATGDKGGDLVALAAYIRRSAQGEAARELAGFLGLPVPTPRGKPGPGPELPASPSREACPPKASTPAKPPRADASPSETCLVPVPADAPAPPLANPRQGKPAHRYEYRTQAGELGFFVDRYQTREGKSFAQLTAWQTAAGAIEWRWKASPAPRLLYGLELLAARPEAPVLVCEGEKAAEAARGLFLGFVVLAWPGGSNAWDKADWAPLAGRDVTLWPDLDEPGATCMDKLAQHLGTLTPAPAALHQVKPEAFGLQEKGADAADLQGWDAARCADVCTNTEWRQSLALQTPPPANRDKAKPAKTKADKPRPDIARPHYTLEANGVYFVEVDREGNPAPPKWVCSYLEPLARVRSPDNQGWGLLVCLLDADNKEHRLVIPMQLFRGEGLEVAGMLLDRGLMLAPGCRQRLIAYLQTARPEARARITARTGWHTLGDGGGVYVLPDLAFGPDSASWLYEPESPAPHAFKVKGTAAQWREQVGALCRGNSRLLFAVSVAFAAPLLHLVGGESGGFHFRSNSSDGKTTALRVACSVCGDGSYMQRWRATDNGLEALAMQHCDALLALDELAQLDPRAAGEVAYMLANGSGKARAARTGGARERSFWRVLFLSAGEISLAQHMAEAGKVTRAGQEIRLADIPADAGAGLGAWEELHGQANGAEFSRAIEQAARKYHGAALVAFLKELTKGNTSLPEQLREAQKRFEARYLTDNASGQARRVADRFALVGMGGELATAWGLTGWQEGEAMGAAGLCFQAWLAGRGGEGNQEEAAMLAQVREFLERHGDGAFDLWHRLGDDRSARTADRAGVRRWIQPDGTPITRASQIEDGSEGAEFQTEYFIFEQPWRTRACKGFDPKAVASMMAARGFLKHIKGRMQARVRIPGFGQVLAYHVTPALFAEVDGA